MASTFDDEKLKTAKLALMGKPKDVMMTNLCLSAEDFDKLVNEANPSN